MDSSLFLRGLVIGFALAAPVGPVGVLCVRRALADGRHAAFIAGMGAAVADTFYGAVAGLGLTFISSFLINHQITLRVIGGLILVVLGWRCLRSAQSFEPETAKGPGLIKDFVSTFLITLTNPATILAFMGVFAALGAIEKRTGPTSSILILGVFAGSALWWLVLSAIASAARTRLSPGFLDWLNKGSGAVLLLFGLGILASLGLDCPRIEPY